MSKSTLFVEDYRPPTIDQCILPKKTEETFKEFVSSGEIPSLLLHGGPGTGKTTAIKAMCNEMGCDSIIINCSEDSGIDVIRNRIRDFASTVSLMNDSKHKVVILDEADGLNPNSSQPALRGFIEEFWSNCRFCFTANYPNKIIPALHSRCSVISFDIPKDEKNQMMAKFYKRCTNILEESEIGFEPQPLVKLIEHHYPDMRRVLNELQRYGASGMIDAGILSSFDNAHFKELVGYLRDKNFKMMRSWITEQSADPNTLFTKLYESAVDVLEPESVPALIVTLGEYQYKQNFVANTDINLAACFTEIMAECSFK